MTGEAGQSRHLIHGLLQDGSVHFPEIRAGGFQPSRASQEANTARHTRGGPREEVDRRGLKHLCPVNADAFQGRFEVGLNLLQGPGRELVMSSQAGAERPLVA